MAEKYYQNDYNKLMGVDESRTASEELVDKLKNDVYKPIEVLHAYWEAAIEVGSINIE